jgi:hypothetical protein
MKTFVKVKYLPVFALLLGSSLALATKPLQEPNVRNIGSKTQPQWVALETADFDCDQTVDNLCTAHRDGAGNISNEQEGQYTP